MHKNKIGSQELDSLKMIQILQSPLYRLQPTRSTTCRTTRETPCVNLKVELCRTFGPTLFNNEGEMSFVT